MHVCVVTVSAAAAAETAAAARRYYDLLDDRAPTFSVNSGGAPRRKKSKDRSTRRLRRAGDDDGRTGDLRSVGYHGRRLCARSLSVWGVLTKHETHTTVLLLRLRKWITYNCSIYYYPTAVVATADGGVSATQVC